ncbi:hypothetical protein SASPL_132227 [Salvia splendens]|uniref:Uncharacterized protein n=1 Tax=Salvia splendens TaxID=180675 RepID=A0A8X8X995_SALSN|nr:hypothetical protein SASPL_132227 [Salvia splendens]
MADVDASKVPSLAEDYLLVEKNQKEIVAEKSVNSSDDKIAEDTTAVECEAALVAGEGAEAANVASEESKESNSVDDTNSPPSEESSDSAESGDAADQEAEETPEIKLTSLAFSKCTHCSLRLHQQTFVSLLPTKLDTVSPDILSIIGALLRRVKRHLSVTNLLNIIALFVPVNGLYSFLVLHSWLQVDRWNEQRENGTFPGPL